MNTYQTKIIFSFAQKIMAKLITQLLIILAAVEMCSLWRNPFYSGSRKKCDCVCNQISTRIRGGELVADMSMYPFMLFLMHPRILCGGVLMTSTHVLTAGHCVESMVPIDSILIILGSLRYIDAIIERRAKKVVIHEKYEHKRLRYVLNDIAIITMKERIEYSRDVRPVCFPRSSRETFEGRKVIVVGYGATEQDAKYLDAKLRHVMVHVVPLQRCKDRYEDFNMTVHDTNLCGGYEKGRKDACWGDSGGPLLATRRGNCKLIGIVSWGLGCGKPNRPNVYTAINKYLDWIKEKVGDESLCLEED